MRAMLVTLAATMLFTGPAWADPKDQPMKNDGDKIVCKREQFVGSIIPKRICMTKSQWEQGAVNAKNALDEKNLRDNPIELDGRQGG